jgi:hypothetical protein
MPQERLQRSRFEQKYIITEKVALQVRDYVRSFLELDVNCVGKPNSSASLRRHRSDGLTKNLLPLWRP